MKLTPAQQLVLSGVLALAASAAAGAASAFIQNYDSGKVDIQSSLLIALGMFGTTFGASLYNYVPAHFAELMQVKDDFLAQLQQNHAQLLSNHQILQETHSATVQELNRALTPPLVRSAVRPSESENATVPLPQVKSGDTIPRVQAMVAQSEAVEPPAT